MNATRMITLRLISICVVFTLLYIFQLCHRVMNPKRIMALKLISICIHRGWFSLCQTFSNYVIELWTPRAWWHWNFKFISLTALSTLGAMNVISATGFNELVEKQSVYIGYKVINLRVGSTIVCCSVPDCAVLVLIRPFCMFFAPSLNEVEEDLLVSPCTSVL